MKPVRGDLALCSKGALGLITESDQQEVTYDDQTKGKAYVGIHLTDKVAALGSPWSSRTPLVVGKLRNALVGYGNLPDYRPEAAVVWRAVVEWEGSL